MHVQRLDLNKNEAAVSLPTPLVVGSSKNGIQTPINIPKLELAYNKGSLFLFARNTEKKRRRERERLEKYVFLMVYLLVYVVCPSSTTLSVLPIWY